MQHRITASINKRYCFSRRVLQLFSKHLDLSMEHIMMLNGYISKGDFMSWNGGEHEGKLLRGSSTIMFIHTQQHIWLDTP